MPLRVVFVAVLVAGAVFFAPSHGLQLLQQAADAPSIIKDITKNASHNNEPPEPIQSAMSEPFSKDVEPRGDISTPRMLVMRGCSGSSAVMLFARALLKLHGIPVPEPWAPQFQNCQEVRPSKWAAELLTPRKNCFYDDAGQDIGEAMKLANAKILSYNQTLFFQGMVEQVADDTAWASMKHGLIQMKVHAVMSSKINPLDILLCQIRDCFNPVIGYPVDDDGQPSDLCFDRRDTTIVTTDTRVLLQTEKSRDRLNSTDTNYKAFVYPDHHITGAIDREIKWYNDAKRHLNGSIPFLEVKSENLLEFEHGGEGALERSLDAWATFMTALGVKPHNKVIKDFLQKFENSYPKAKPHSELIYNWQDVKKYLKGTSYFKYWRD